MPASSNKLFSVCGPKGSDQPQNHCGVLECTGVSSKHLIEHFDWDGREEGKQGKGANFENQIKLVRAREREVALRV